MAAAVVSAGTVPSRPAWRGRHWIVPLTLLWILLTYWLPIIPASGVQTAAHQLTAHGLIAVGLWLGLESADLTPAQRRTTWLAIMIPYTLWFASPGARPSMAPSERTPHLYRCCRWRSSCRSSSARRCCCCRSGWGRCSMRCRQAGSSRFKFIAYSAVGLSSPGCMARCRAYSRCRRELAMCLPACSPCTARSPWRPARLGTQGGHRLEYFRPRRFRRRDHSRGDHLARPVPADRSGCAEHRRRRLSGCADAGFCRAELDPAARAFAAPTGPASPGRGGETALMGVQMSSATGRIGSRSEINRTFSIVADPAVPPRFSPLAAPSTVSRSIAAPGTLFLRRSQASPSRSARSASQTASHRRSETGIPFADPASAPRTRA